MNDGNLSTNFIKDERYEKVYMIYRTFISSYILLFIYNCIYLSFLIFTILELSYF